MNIGKTPKGSPLHDLGGKFTPYLYLFPTFVITFVFLIYPLLGTLRFSFLEWDGLGTPRFIAFGNYSKLWGDPRFWAAFRSNLIYIVFFSIIPTVLGLMIASLFGRRKIKGARFFRAFLLVPQAIASVAIGTVFNWIYAPRFGLLNQIIQIISKERFRFAWLGDPHIAPFAIGFIGTWLWLGFSIALFIAGIQKIEPSIYEACKLDGASSFQEFFYITLPSLKSEIGVALVVTLIRALSTNIFGIVSATTGGANNTRPISLYAYQIAFVQWDLGYSSAIIVFLAAVVFALSRLIQLWFSER